MKVKKQQILVGIVAIIIIAVAVIMLWPDKEMSYILETSTGANRTIKVNRTKLDQAIYELQDGKGLAVGKTLGVVFIGNEIKEYILVAWDNYSNYYYIYYVYPNSTYPTKSTTTQNYPKPWEFKTVLNSATMDIASGNGYGFFELENDNSSTQSTNQEQKQVEGNQTVSSTLNRGDIVTFEAPTVSSSIDSPILTNDTLTQRVIGTAGDHVKITDGSVYINGERLTEPYLNTSIITRGKTYNDLIVPEGYVFLMGDDREHSTDSRDFGCISIDKII